jgi:hypothetical protein
MRVKNEPERVWGDDIWVWNFQNMKLSATHSLETFSPRMLQIIDVIHTFHMGHPHRKYPENRGLLACSRLTVASSNVTAVISLKLIQNYEILTITQRFTHSSYWLILRFLTII